MKVISWAQKVKKLNNKNYMKVLKIKVNKYKQNYINKFIN